MTRDYRSEAYQLVAGDELARIQRQIAEVQAVAPMDFPFTQPEAAAFRRVMDDLAENKPYPDMGAVIQEERVARQVAGAANQLRLEVLAALNQQAREAREQAGPAAIPWLGEQLTELMDAVLETDRILGPVATAADALNAGSKAAKAWQTLATHLADYRALRSTQVVFTTQAGHAGGLSAIYAVGLTQGLADQVYKINTKQHEPDTTGWPRVQSGTFMAWPGDTGLEELLPSTEPETYLRWIAHRGDAWVPTADQIEERISVRLRCIQERTAEEDLPELQTYTYRTNTVIEL